MVHDNQAAVTHGEFETYRVHVDRRFEQTDRKLDHIDSKLDKMILVGTQPKPVPWGAIVTLIIGVAAIAGAIIGWGMQTQGTSGTNARVIQSLLDDYHDHEILNGHPDMRERMARVETHQQWLQWMSRDVLWTRTTSRFDKDDATTMEARIAADINRLEALLTPQIVKDLAESYRGLQDAQADPGSAGGE